MDHSQKLWLKLADELRVATLARFRGRECCLLILRSADFALPLARQGEVYAEFQRSLSIHAPFCGTCFFQATVVEKTMNPNKRAGESGYGASSRLCRTLPRTPLIPASGASLACRIGLSAAPFGTNSFSRDRTPWLVVFHLRTSDVCVLHACWQRVDCLGADISVA